MEVKIPTISGKVSEKSSGFSGVILVVDLIGIYGVNRPVSGSRFARVNLFSINYGT